MSLSHLHYAETMTEIIKIISLVEKLFSFCLSWRLIQQCGIFRDGEGLEQTVIMGGGGSSKGLQCGVQMWNNSLPWKLSQKTAKLKKKKLAYCTQRERYQYSTALLHQANDLITRWSPCGSQQTPRPQTARQQPVMCEVFRLRTLTFAASASVDNLWHFNNSSNLQKMICHTTANAAALTVNLYST